MSDKLGVGFIGLHMGGGQLRQVATMANARVAAICDVENVASARVLEKAGMLREARFRDDALVRGTWRSSYLYAILEGDRKGGTR